ncbi:MAG: hypothetical protein N2484_16600 [Clostridia bacterium]|nr:hypothetical protein [Clostridia bacterium]
MRKNRLLYIFILFLISITLSACTGKIQTEVHLGYPLMLLGAGLLFAIQPRTAYMLLAGLIFRRLRPSEAVLNAIRIFSIAVCGVAVYAFVIKLIR